MTRDALAAKLQSANKERVAVIDVRDDDYIGGHIKGSQNVPSSALDYRIPELLRTLKGRDMVVFHCALSQQRGPTAARRYLAAKQQAMAATGASKGEGASEASHGEPPPKQEVYILDGGFNKWQEK